MKRSIKILKCVCLSLILGYLIIPLILACMIVVLTLISLFFVLIAYLGAPGAFALHFSHHVDVFTNFVLNIQHYFWIGLLGSALSLCFFLSSRN